VEVLTRELCVSRIKENFKRIPVFDTNFKLNEGETVCKNQYDDGFHRCVAACALSEETIFMVAKIDVDSAFDDVVDKHNIKIDEILEDEMCDLQCYHDRAMGKRNQLDSIHTFKRKLSEFLGEDVDNLIKQNYPEVAT